jgi:hypothetical protein
MELNKYFIERDKVNEGHYEVLYLEENGQKFYPGKRWEYCGLSEGEAERICSKLNKKFKREMGWP